MTKKKSAPKKSVSKKAVVKRVTQKTKCCSNNPNFMVVLLAGSIIAIVFLFRFL